jgi:pyruvate dehydrogenase E2 component (dihydrolipoamide acetyltransferase)
VANPIEVLVPDIGGFTDVSVIEVLVEDGQQIAKETPLITLETEKASMDVPAPSAGRIAAMRLKRGDKVSQGSLILLLEAAGAVAPAAVAAPAGGPAATPAAVTAPSGGSAATPAAVTAPSGGPAATPAAVAAPSGGPAATPAAVPPPAAVPAVAAGTAAAPAPRPADEPGFSQAHASPSIRKFARELGADLGRIKGTGPKGRITAEDVKAHVKAILAAPPPAAPSPAAAGFAALPKVPEVDFAKFGPVELRPLSRIQRISGARLQASWINLPHVTQHDEADITDLESVRSGLKDKAAQAGVRLTPLAFIVRACLLALKEYPAFNASLDASGENLVLKRYFHIGFAADTPNGLVVPVIRDADRMDIYEIARSLGAMSEKARAGKLTAAEMQGGTFTISSLGGIGGTAFTPIINAPEVAILGVSKTFQKPVYLGGTFLPRLTLPLSLSYDHRVIDGAAAARFTVYLAKVLGDVRALL